MKSFTYVNVIAQFKNKFKDFYKSILNFYINKLGEMLSKNIE